MGDLYFKWLGIPYGWDSDIGTQTEELVNNYIGDAAVKWIFTGDGLTHWLEYEIPSGSEVNLASGSHTQMWAKINSSHDINFDDVYIYDLNDNYFSKTAGLTISSGSFQDVHVDLRNPDIMSGSLDTTAIHRFRMNFDTVNGVEYTVIVDMFRFEKPWSK
ncbi:MAG: hypothetical protein ACTSRA_00420 [Promethearchaeota archaeon]|nr:MAG: hypothetical protein [Helarchaeota virus Nidhogg Meg22_1012]URC17419.1 MAG: hypothetical protein [Helarchaeota virus Nidhogg Meg22_1214]